jgi:hypothetical protein
MARESEKLLMTRADAAKAALAATMAARDANAAREILERSLSELKILTDTVETLNYGLAVLSQRPAEQNSAAGADAARDIADLKVRVAELSKANSAAKKKKKKKRKKHRQALDKVTKRPGVRPGGVDGGRSIAATFFYSDRCAAPILTRNGTQ